MKSALLIFLLFFSINLNALTIKLNVTKENKIFIHILHITNDTPFTCKKKIVNIKQNEYICKINGKNDIQISPKKNKALELYLTNKDKITLIKIKPKEKVKIFKFNKPLYKRKTITNHRSNYAKHWIFIFYQDKLFLKDSSNQNGINFPIDFLKEVSPSVDALDLSGTPVSYLNNSKDINDYLSIKNDYDKQRYNFVIIEAKKALKNYPHSIFVNDFMLYYIRSLDKILKTMQENPDTEDLSYDEIIKLGKKWIKNFPSNQNIPEVLYYIATAYQQLGQGSNAKYFYDILITEHPKSKYAKLGIIAFADSLYSKNKKQKAIQLYKDVLYSTKDIETASIAADRLANAYMKMKKYKKARVYFEKIIEANPDFFLKDHQKAYDLAIKLSSYKMNDIATQILEKLLKKLKVEPDLKELVIKQLGDIYAKNKQYKKASHYYKLYLSLYKYGNYTDEVKKSLDGLFFDIDETNTTKLILYFDKLMKHYKSGDIYEKAAILKAKTLAKEKKYTKALNLLNDLETNFKNKKIVKKLKNDIAYVLAISELKNQNCLKAIRYITEYNITVKTEQKKLVKCYLQTYNYKKAYNISQKMLKKSNTNGVAKLFWLDIEAKSLLQMRAYKKLLSVSEDILTLSKTFNKKIYIQNGLDYKFFALYGLKQYDKAMQVVQKIDKNFSDNFNNIEIYKKVIDLARKRVDDLMIIKYAKKILKLQEKYKSYILSPEIEFIYITSLKRLGKNKDAINILKALIKRVKSPTILSRAYYEMGALFLKLQNKTAAKKAFEKCLNIKSKNSWKSLCTDSLSLL